MNVLVTMKIGSHSEYHEIQDVVSHELLVFLSKYDIKPILVPNRAVDLDSLIKEHRPKGIILSGGNDLMLNSQKHSPLYFRNKTENFLIHYALNSGTPLFGICRGFQMINIYLGGSVQLIAAENHVGSFHSIQVFLGKYTDSDIYTNIKVNSFHNYGIQKSNLAADLSILGLSADNWVEAFEHSNLPILGVQWHPERENPHSEHLDDFLIKRWIALCN